MDNVAVADGGRPDIPETTGNWTRFNPEGYAGPSTRRAHPLPPPETTSSFIIRALRKRTYPCQPMHRPHSGHSVGPVAKVVRQAGQVVSGAEGSMTISAAASAANRCSASRLDFQSFARSSRQASTSRLATASHSVVFQELPLFSSGHTMAAAMPCSASRSATRSRSACGPRMTTMASVSSLMGVTLIQF